MTKIFSIMMQNDAEDEDDDVEEDDDTPALAASQALDTLALNLPPEKYISALLSQVRDNHIMFSNHFPFQFTQFMKELLFKGLPFENLSGQRRNYSISKT